MVGFANKNNISKSAKNSTKENFKYLKSKPVIWDALNQRQSRNQQKN